MKNPFKLIGSWTLAILFLIVYLLENGSLFFGCHGACPKIYEPFVYLFIGFLLGWLGDMIFNITPEIMNDVKHKSDENYSQQHGEKPTYSGEVDRTESLDSDRKINSGFDDGGTSSKNPPADTTQDANHKSSEVKDGK